MTNKLARFAPFVFTSVLVGWPGCAGSGSGPGGQDVPQVPADGEEVFAEALGETLVEAGEGIAAIPKSAGEPCTDDIQCGTGLCMKETGICTEPCAASDACENGTFCAPGTSISGRPVQACVSKQRGTCPSCSGDGDCAGFLSPICSKDFGTCVQCLEHYDCGGSNTCVYGTCEFSSGPDSQHPAKTCPPACKKCGEGGVCLCTADAECPKRTRCNAGKCDGSCLTDCDCGPARPICREGGCSDCKTDTGCGLGKVCGSPSPFSTSCVPGCASNHGCPVEKPVCAEECFDINGGTEFCKPSCRQCKADEECGAGSTCQTATGRCIVCVTDADCGPGLYCAKVKCLPTCQATGCPAGLVCNAKNHKCGECSVEHPCASGKCVVTLGKCVDCLVDGDCPQGHFCKAKACVESCDLLGCPAGLVCHPKTHACAQCAQGHPCSTGVCDEEKGQCVECLTDADCKALGKGPCEDAKCVWCTLVCGKDSYGFSCATVITELSCITSYDKGNPVSKECLVDLGGTQVHVLTTYLWSGGKLVSTIVSVNEWPGKSCKF